MLKSEKNQIQKIVKHTEKLTKCIGENIEKLLKNQLPK